MSMSFTHYEKTYRPRLREAMDQSESTQDVKKRFFQIVRDMLDEIPNCDVDLVYEGLELTLDKAPGYAFKEEYFDESIYKCVTGLLEASDLDRILKDFAETAANRYRQLDKNPAKTESKGWGVPGSHEMGQGNTPSV